MSTQESRAGRRARLLGQQARVVGRAVNRLPLAETDVAAVGRHVDFYQAFLAHVPGDEWWQPADHSAKVAHVTAPVNMVSGWYDLFLPWQLRDYAALRAAGRQPYLLIGPWFHGATPSIAPLIREALAWFRAHLFDDRSALREAPVRLYVMGANAWRDFTDWPPQSTAQRWHLQPNQGLTPEIAPESEPDQYRYDPADPTPAVGGTSLNEPYAGPRDNRELERRNDVLIYTSVPLDRDLEVIGPVSAELYARSTLDHTDYLARLCVVEPSGKSTNLCDGIVRLTPGSAPVNATGYSVVRIELWPTAYRFKRGDRLRVHVASGAHPRYARNPGTGEPLATATKLRVAEQTVAHDAAHPSAIILPVLA
jgi:putative CocE/NonD family hydrolase